MNEMELQDRQYELDGASNVYVGPSGADGITPTVIVEDITGGHQVSFYYGAGDSRNKSFTVPNGQNGTNGADGITPSMSVSDITGGHRLTVTYAAGDSRNFYIDIMNGANGTDGAAGQAATVSIGTVETLPAGSSAYVVNAGTETAAVLNIGIPQGAKGDASLFPVNITGSSYTRTSDKTPAQIKAAVDAGMMVIANIAADNTKAYLFQSTASRAEFRTLCLQGLSNEYPSMMWQEFNLASANSTTVNVTYTSITSAEPLVGLAEPHITFIVDWNDGKYFPQTNTLFNETDWNLFYDGNMRTITAYLNSREWSGSFHENTTFMSRKIWKSNEYDSEYGDNVNVGNIIFIHTEIDASNGKLITTEIHWKHYIWNNRLEIVKRIIAEGAVTATTDYPQQYDPS